MSSGYSWEGHIVSVLGHEAGEVYLDSLTEVFALRHHVKRRVVVVLVACLQAVA